MKFQIPSSSGTESASRHLQLFGGAWVVRQFVGQLLVLAQLMISGSGEGALRLALCSEGGLLEDSLCLFPLPVPCLWLVRPLAVPPAVL